MDASFVFGTDFDGFSYDFENKGFAMVFTFNRLSWEQLTLKITINVFVTLLLQVFSNIKKDVRIIFGYWILR